MSGYVNRYSFIVLIFCTIEQGLVALSTVSTVELGRALSGGDSNTLIFWSFVLVVSLLAVFIPRFGYQYFIELVKYRVFERYLEVFERKIYNSPYIMKDKSLYSDRKSVFNNEVWNVVTYSCDYMLDVVLTLMNIIFNVLVLSIAIDVKFIPVYLLTFAVVLLLITAFRKKSDLLSDILQKSRIKLNSIVLFGFDTLVCGNRYNLNVWKESINYHISEVREKIFKRESFVSVSSGAIMFCGALPIIIFVYILFRSSSNIGERVALIVTLPRQINMIQYINVMIVYIFGISNILVRNKTILKSTDIIDCKSDCETYIQFNLIKIKKNSKSIEIKNMKKLSEFIQKEKNGRITICGENGSGKSTILAVLKEKLGDDAYLFSQCLNLYFDGSDSDSKSSGEEAVIKLENILNKVYVKYLLLDEWDANLDKYNISILSSKINDVAKHKLIIEVRHRNTE